MITNEENDSSSSQLDIDKGKDEQLEFSIPSNIDDEIIARFIGASDQVKEGEKDEKEMGFKKAFSTYPKSAIWSVVISSGIIMEGYDTCLSMIALPIFCERFGVWNPKSQVWEIPAKWQSAMGMCANVGEIIGLQIAGTVADRFGYRYTLIGSLFSLAVFIFLIFFAKSLGMICAGQILCGIPWGFFQTLAVSYASEVCPMTMRFYLTSYVNVCWLLGQLFGSGIMKNSQDNLAHSDMGWRLPYGLMWIWPVPIAIAIFCAPESPWWLVKKNRVSKAAHSLSRLLTIKDPDQKEIVIDTMLKRMKFTSDKEEADGDIGSYRECFSKKHIRRTRIASMVWIGQMLTGCGLMGSSTYFYEKAGLSTSYSFDFSIIQYCIGIIGAIVSWFVSNNLGRATLYIWGTFCQGVLLWIMGILGFVKQTNAVRWTCGSILLVLSFVYDCTVGPVTYCIVTEIPSGRVRTKTVIIARNLYNLFGIFDAFMVPYQLNSTQWNWGAKSGLFWAAFATIWFVWGLFDLPETKGRTFADIDQLFEEKVSARKFKSTVVDPFNNAKMLQQFDREKLNELANIRADRDIEDSKVDIEKEGDK